MKLIDCFMYFDEDLLLDVRLHTLDKIVDKFVISESTKDHAGNNNKLKFNINNFSKYKNKIRYIVEDNLPKEVGYFKKNWSPDWIRENMHRNSLSTGYKDFNDEDVIMISDLDEIPNPNEIKKYDENKKYACFIQKNFQAKLNLLNTTDSDWAGTKITKKKYLQSPQWLRNLKTKERPFWKFYKPRQPQIILNGGWHFSYLKNSSGISKKIQSFAHQEYNKEEFINLQKIEERLKKNIDIFGRNYNYKKISIDETFPDYIYKNQDKFKNWIA